MLERFGIPKAEREVIFPIIDASEAAVAVMELPADPGPAGYPDPAHGYRPGEDEDQDEDKDYDGEEYDDDLLDDEEFDTEV